MSDASLKSYRKAIGDAWLPVVGRRRLTSTEYEFIEQLFDKAIEIEMVLRAIRKCASRAQGRGNTIYSLGVIRADLEAVMREKSRTKVGAGQASQDAWREQWRRDLNDLISVVDEPFRSAYQLLLVSLAALSLEEALEQWRAIQQLKKDK